MNSSPWKKQTLHPDCERIECPPHDPIRDFKPEPTGIYVLIRVDQEKHQIELAICNRDHQITHIFIGKKSQDLYCAIFKHKAGELFQSKNHIAYLGKELKKAELALEHGTIYLQE